MSTAQSSKAKRKRVDNLPLKPPKKSKGDRKPVDNLPLKPPKKSKGDRLKERLGESNLVNQSNVLIEKAFQLQKFSKKDTVPPLVDEMVHSILFSGHMLVIEIEPRDMLSPEVVEILDKYFVTALEGFKNKLPRRTPFSCLLELIVEIKGKENRDEVMEELSAITKKLDCGSKNQLIGFVLCITQCEESGKILSYGASIPYAEDQYKEIWIALSCLYTWHHHVSYAVMQCSRGEPRRVSFPSLKDISCTAYDAKGKKEIQPCAKCCELFSLQRDQPEQEPNTNLYGNCAETEAISKLLILREVPFDDGEFETLKRDTTRELIQRLEKVNAKTFNADVVYKPATSATPKS